MGMTTSGISANPLAHPTVKLRGVRLPVLPEGILPLGPVLVEDDPLEARMPDEDDPEEVVDPPLVDPRGREEVRDARDLGPVPRDLHGDGDDGPVGARKLVRDVDRVAGAGGTHLDEVVAAGGRRRPADPLPRPVHRRHEPDPVPPGLVHGPAAPEGLRDPLPRPGPPAGPSP